MLVFFCPRGVNNLVFYHKLYYLKHLIKIIDIKFYKKKSFIWNRLLLVKKLFNSRMHANSFMVNHLNEFNIIWTKLKLLESVLLLISRLWCLWVLFQIVGVTLLWLLAVFSGTALKFNDVVSIIMNNKSIKKKENKWEHHFYKYCFVQ